MHPTGNLSTQLDTSLFVHVNALLHTHQWSASLFSLLCCSNFFLSKFKANLAPFNIPCSWIKATNHCYQLELMFAIVFWKGLYSFWRTWQMRWLFLNHKNSMFLFILGDFYHCQVANFSFWNSYLKLVSGRYILSLGEVAALTDVYNVDLLVIPVAAVASYLPCCISTTEHVTTKDWTPRC